MAPFPPEDPSSPSAETPPTEEPRFSTRRDLPEVPPRPTFQQRALAAAARLRKPRSTPNPKQHKQHPKRLLHITETALAVLALILIVVLIAAISLRRDMRAALPQLDGTIHTPGLAAPVTVTRNEQGVPSIHATSLNDLLFAQGYTTAQDRLWQMDALRRHASGELAEILGPSLLDHDKQQRTLQLRAAADNAIAAMSPDQRAQLQSYANGVNAFLTTHPNHLPVEFSFLHYKPTPWQPRDSVLVVLTMWQSLSTEFPRKLAREALMRHLPASLATDLYPVGSFRDHPPSTPPTDLTTPVDEIEQIPLDSTQSSLITPSDILHRTQALGLATCDNCRDGSNNWAVSGTRSASGQPLLSNDMHLGLAVPDIWYEAALHIASPTAPLDVTGFTLPGVPFVIVGRNTHVAWSFTNLGADVQDLYVEHTRGTGNNLEYQRPDNTWAPVQHHAEHIRVRFGHDVTLDVLTTTHSLGAKTLTTPIISALYPSETRTLSLAWTAFDPTTLALPLLAINTANSGAALAAATATFGGPSLNLIYADDANHIGYHAIGNIPVRGPAVQHPRALPPLILPTDEQPEPNDEDNQPGASPDQSSEPDAMLNPPASLCDGLPSRSDRPSTNLSSQFPLSNNLSSRPKREARSGETCSSPAAPQLSTGTATFTDAAWHPNTTSAHFLATAYEPQRRHRRTASPTPPPTHTRTRHKTIVPTTKLKPTVTPEPTPSQATIAPVPALLDYTIGSPISPIPVDALDPNQQWSGYIPYDALPSITDPPSGILITANARITPDNYPYAIANDWSDPYRVERLHHLLDHRTALTPADMLATELDTHSKLDRFLAHRLAYAVDHASKSTLDADPTRLHQAADILRAWDGNVTLTATAPSIIQAVRPSILYAMIAAQIRAHDHLKANDRSADQLATLYAWEESGTTLELLLNRQPKHWLPTGFATWNDFLASTLATALHGAHAPHDLSKWTYASTHHTELDHPLFTPGSHLGRILGTKTSPGATPTPGDATTVRASGPAFGPSERFTADLANPASTLANITTGESGNPASPNYLDQFLPWLQGTTFPMPLNQTPTIHTLTLEP
jgi:acyl-homoserine lactone acylase PvdQ